MKQIKKVIFLSIHEMLEMGIEIPKGLTLCDEEGGYRGQYLEHMKTETIDCHIHRYGLKARTAPFPIMEYGIQVDIAISEAFVKESILQAISTAIALNA